MENVNVMPIVKKRNVSAKHASMVTRIPKAAHRYPVVTNVKRTHSVKITSACVNVVTMATRTEVVLIYRAVVDAKEIRTAKITHAYANLVTAEVSRADVTGYPAVASVKRTLTV